MTEETKRGPGRPGKEETVQARVLRDYWPSEDQSSRVRKDQIIDVTKDELIEGMEAGHLERVK